MKGIDDEFVGNGVGKLNLVGCSSNCSKCCTGGHGRSIPNQLRGLVPASPECVKDGNAPTVLVVAADVPAAEKNVVGSQGWPAGRWLLRSLAAKQSRERESGAVTAGSAVERNPAKTYFLRRIATSFPA